MKPLRIGKYKEKFYTPGKTIEQHDKERREKASEIAKNHKDSKPIKFLLKRK
ncbi:hypothetical protein [Chryseobacterium sp. EO14]|uniref:hypothetical protein n=1 Tax=Chryseobacterium sp. EO14 TaxID=2950551 RepID=UPI00210D6406|nr:hypothetical protein [Chryseobacterium sp. EO14]MCQ4139209.1 hypothetical protein [Chryseobacterium sp. EO14]